MDAAVLSTVVVTDHGMKSLLFVLCLLLLSVAAMAQDSARLWVTANVRPSVLFSGAGPDGSAFAEGGDQRAFVTLAPAAAPSQTFTTRAVAANNPRSSGYELRARLSSPAAGGIVLDGIVLSTANTVISRDIAYGEPQSHTLEVTGADPSTRIILTCTPN
jgi:hypothetical protein